MRPRTWETNTYKKTTINTFPTKRIISEMNQYIPRKRVVTLHTSLPHQMQTGIKNALCTYITKAFPQKCTIRIQAGPYRSTACDPSPVNTRVEYTVQRKYKQQWMCFLEQKTAEVVTCTTEPRCHRPTPVITRHCTNLWTVTPWWRDKFSG